MAAMHAANPSLFLNKPVVSVPALIAESAARWANQPVLWRWVDARFEPVYFGTLLHGVATLAQRLTELGARPGERVAIRHGDRFAFGVTYLAVLWTGAAAVPLDPMLTVTEVSGILNDSESSLFVTDSLIAHSEELRAKTRTVELSSIWPGFDNSRAEIPVPPSIDPASMAVLIFTSGTTGYSKGVMLSHANLATDVMAIREMNLLEHTDLLLSVLPMHHAFESTAGLLYPLSIGAQVAYARSLKSNEIIEDLRATKATIILAVPLLYEKMANSIQKKVSDAPAIRRTLFGVLSKVASAGHAVGWKTSGQTLFRSARAKAGLGSLRFFVSGGAALPPEVSKFFDSFGIPIVQGYGLTECSPVATVNRPGHHRYDSVGPALPGVEIRIDNPGADGIGEIAVRGPMVMQGYWKRPEDTEAVLQDGWLLTGDLGSIDSDGHVHVVGRSKNVIISGAGKNIYPEEIESVLNAQPGIGDSMVYGLQRDGKTGESVAAIIVPDHDWFSAVNPSVLHNDNSLRQAIDQVVKAACAHMAPYKRIVEWHLRRDPFELTSTRKIKRAVALKQLAESQGKAATTERKKTA